MLSGTVGGTLIAAKMYLLMLLLLGFLLLLLLMLMLVGTDLSDRGRRGRCLIVVAANGVIIGLL